MLCYVQIHMLCSVYHIGPHIAGIDQGCQSENKLPYIAYSQFQEVVAETMSGRLQMLRRLIGI